MPHQFHAHTGGAVIPILSGTNIYAPHTLLPSGQAGGNIFALTWPANLPM
jgi:hypothetical protein